MRSPVISHPQSMTGPSSMIIERQCLQTYFLGNSTPTENTDKAIQTRIISSVISFVVLLPGASTFSDPQLLGWNIFAALGPCMLKMLVYPNTYQ